LGREPSPYPLPVGMSIYTNPMREEL
jgi:hypothetical protein